MDKLKKLKSLRIIIYSLIPALVLSSFLGYKYFTKVLAFLLFGAWAFSWSASFFFKAKNSYTAVKATVFYVVALTFFALGFIGLVTPIVQLVV